MVSIERDDVGYRRALFNSPYATVRVLHGSSSSSVLPTLYDDEVVRGRPWMIWLDYDYAFDETLKDDITSVIENAAPNSIFLITFNCHEEKYGNGA